MFRQWQSRKVQIVFALIIAMASNGKSKHTPNLFWNLKNEALLASVYWCCNGGPGAGLPNWTRSRLIRECRCSRPCCGTVPGAVWPIVHPYAQPRTEPVAIKSDRRSIVMLMPSLIKRPFSRINHHSSCPALAPGALSTRTDISFVQHCYHHHSCSNDGWQSGLNGRMTIRYEF